jgi:hypothetical protein
MINVPSGMAQFCDVPPAESHLHPGVGGNGGVELLLSGS